MQWCPDIGLDLWLVQYDPRQFPLKLEIQLKLALNGLDYVAFLAGEPEHIAFIVNSPLLSNLSARPWF